MVTSYAVAVPSTLQGRLEAVAQLYPSFSSGAMARIFILNDLFVAPEARRRGAGSALLEAG
jgi:GNAT superfamily N-acetyltransferase